ncbi:endosomal/lysosomal proton channel TMEM175-like [Clytia hemisphaerica]|uniref:Endosomal/lysosomal proton channel TMEM175 n=1 Tax=Clytia hemisphaerica TaxID=252671 RepID=A0A7M5WLS0_9CNID
MEEGSSRNKENFEMFDVVQENNNEKAGVSADVTEPGRLRSYGDAVFATAATLLIVPVLEFNIKREETLKEALSRHVPKFLVFLGGHLVICSVWELQLVRQKIIGKTDDFLAILNLLSLVFVTFLPFGVRLASNYPDLHTSVSLNFLLLLEKVLELVMLKYASWKKLLSVEYQALDNVEIAKEKETFWYCVLFLFTLLMAWGSVHYMGYVTIALAIFIPYVIAFCRWLWKDSSNSLWKYWGCIERERMETLTDGALVIVGTILVIDFSTDNFPTESAIQKYGLWHCLTDKRYNFQTYLGTYLGVCIIWFTHHSVVRQFEKFTPILVIVNNFFLAFMACIPFLAKLVYNTNTADFITNSTSTLNSTMNHSIVGNPHTYLPTAVAFSSSIILIGSLTNIILLIASFCNIEQKDGKCCEIKCSKISSDKVYLILTAIVVPFLSLITMLVSLTSTSKVTVEWTFKGCMVVAPFVLFFLKCYFGCCRKGSSSSYEQILNADPVEPRSKDNANDDDAKDDHTKDDKEESSLTDRKSVTSYGSLSVRSTSQLNPIELRRIKNKV